MVGERDQRFYCELKQTNDDLYNYLTKCREKSPYFDYTPTLNDYVKQVGELLRQYPEKTSSSSSTSIFGQASTSANSSTITTATNCISNTNTNSSAPSSVMSSLAAAPVTTNNPTSNLANTPSNLFSSSIFQSTTFMAPTSTSSLPSLSQPPTQLSATPSSQTTAPTTTPFLFGSLSTPFQTSTASPAAATPFSFSLPKKDETLTNNNSTIGSTTDDNNKTVGDEQDDAPPPAPNVDKYEEKDAKYSVKAKLYEKDKSVGGEVSLNLLGLGYLYVKNYDSPNKLQVIFRQEPDLRRVLLNEVVTPSIPIGRLPQKAVHIVFPSTNVEGSSRSYVLKAKDEKDADALYNTLNSLKS